ncbi:hypothetical protein ADL35_36655, partial [Streptomyces sp. NRRL WC-3753]
MWTTLKWTAARTVLRTVGRASRGIRIGYRFGFDSGVMLDHVYENRARGVLGVGRLIDRVFLDAVGWRAIRARRELLSRVLLGPALTDRALPALVAPRLPARKGVAAGAVVLLARA